MRTFFLVIALALAVPAAAGASAPKLIVTSPASGQPVAGQFPISAHVRVPKKIQVRAVRFYVEGSLLATDRIKPFRLAKGKTFDASAMPPGSSTLNIAARLSIRRPGNRIVVRWLRRAVSVSYFRPPSATDPLALENWNLAFDDSFDSAATSARNWNTQRDDWIKGGRPYSNLEGAGYLAANAGVANGVLNLKTADSPASGYPISTGSVNSHRRFAFQYGYLEARVLVPSCDGCWPSFWMLASDDHWPPEIDIFEFFDTLAGDRHPWSALHWPSGNAAGEEFANGLLASGDQVGGWHTYGVLWSRQQVQYFFDGVAGPQFSDATHAPGEPMYPVLQLAVQAGHHPAAGSTMQVDYVRAWVPAG